MSKNTKTMLLVTLSASMLAMTVSSTVQAQYPVAVATTPVAVTPAVVGYSAERAGLLGLQTRYRPNVVR